MKWGDVRDGLLGAPDVPPARLPPLALLPGAPPRPLVSVVLTTCGRARHLPQTLHDVLGQTLQDFELLVRDDGATGDGTEEVVRAVAAGDSRVVYHRNQSQLGLAGNLNEGIRASRGIFVASCHDHDRLDPQWLFQLVSLLQTHPTALLAHCGCSLIDEHDEPTGERHVRAWSDLTVGATWLELMLNQRDFLILVCPLSVVRRSAYEQFGLYQTRYSVVPDVEMSMRLSMHGDVGYSPGPLVRMRIREPDHRFHRDSWPFLLELLDIHRRYLRRSGATLRRRAAFEANADAVIVRELARQVRHGGGVHFGAAAPWLRAAAGPITRCIGALTEAPPAGR